MVWLPARQPARILTRDQRLLAFHYDAEQLLKLLVSKARQLILQVSP